MLPFRNDRKHSFDNLAMKKKVKGQFRNVIVKKKCVRCVDVHVCVRMDIDENQLFSKSAAAHRSSNETVSFVSLLFLALPMMIE